MSLRDRIDMDEDLFLSPPEQKDKPLLVKFLNEKEIYNNTLKIPFPYTEKDADFFLKITEDKRKAARKQLEWVIRRKDGELLGAIAFHNRYGNSSHKDEIGYWLAKPYWGRGIMTKAVKALCNYGFHEFNLVRIEAYVYYFNDPSCRVLEKCGFELEGILKKNVIKDGRYIDGKLYALVK